jgi:hypothetical protein
VVDSGSAPRHLVAKCTNTNCEQNEVMCKASMDTNGGLAARMRSSLPIGIEEALVSANST